MFLTDKGNNLPPCFHVSRNVAIRFRGVRCWCFFSHWLHHTSSSLIRNNIFNNIVCYLSSFLRYSRYFCFSSCERGCFFRSFSHCGHVIGCCCCFIGEWCHAWTCHRRLIQHRHFSARLHIGACDGLRGSCCIRWGGSWLALRGCYFKESINLLIPRLRICVCCINFILARQILTSKAICPRLDCPVSLSPLLQNAFPNSVCILSVTSLLKSH